MSYFPEGKVSDVTGKNYSINETTDNHVLIVAPGMTFFPNEVTGSIDTTAHDYTSSFSFLNSTRQIQAMYSQSEEDQSKRLL